jgi:hypothetical protein
MLSIHKQIFMLSFAVDLDKWGPSWHDLRTRTRRSMKVIMQITLASRGPFPLLVVNSLKSVCEAGGRCGLQNYIVRKIDREIFFRVVHCMALAVGEGKFD